MINLDVDTAKITRLQTKFQKYGPYALKEGLKASADYLNTPSFKESMYPLSQSGSPFVWSSERQRRFVMANIKLPSVRTFELANAGEFTINETSYWVGYVNRLPWAKWVQSTMMIVGHRLRGWKPVNEHVVKASSKIVPLFKKRVIEAWTEMDNFIMGGGGGI